MDQDAHSLASDSPERGSGLVGWLLLAIAVGAFCPCVLVPEWRDYRLAMVALQAEEHRLASLQRVVDRDRRLLTAIQADPAVIARLARRELGYNDPRQRSVAVDVTAASVGLKWEGVAPFIPKPVAPPALVIRLARFLPDLDYERIFCDPYTRRTVMAMSVVLMGVAIWRPGRRPTTRKAHGPSTVGS